MKNNILNIFIVLYMFFYSYAAMAAEEQSNVFKTIKLDFVELGLFTGEVISKHESYISSVVEGQIEQILDFGDNVKKNETIAFLSNPSLTFKKNGLLFKKKEIENLYNFYLERGKRFEKLKQKEAIKGELFLENNLEIFRYMGKIKTINNLIEELDYNIAKLKVNAPFNGVLISKSKDIGEWINKGENIVLLQNNDNYLMKVSLPVSYLSFVKSGLQHVSFIEKKQGITYSIQQLVPPTQENPNFFTAYVNLGTKGYPGERYQLTLKIIGDEVYKVNIDAIKKINGEFYVWSYDTISKKNVKHPVEIIRYEFKYAILKSLRKLPIQLVDTIDE